MVDAVHAAYLPASQSVHALVATGSGWYWPASQSEQAAEPCTAKVPGPHTVQSAAL